MKKSIYSQFNFQNNVNWNWLFPIHGMAVPHEIYCNNTVLSIVISFGQLEKLQGQYLSDNYRGSPNGEFYDRNMGV